MSPFCWTRQKLLKMIPVVQTMKYNWNTLAEMYQENRIFMLGNRSEKAARPQNFIYLLPPVKNINFHNWMLQRVY